MHKRIFFSAESEMAISLALYLMRRWTNNLTLYITLPRRFIIFTLIFWFMVFSSSHHHFIYYISCFITNIRHFSISIINSLLVCLFDKQKKRHIKYNKNEEREQWPSPHLFRHLYFIFYNNIFADWINFLFTSPWQRTGAARYTHKTRGSSLK